MKTQLTLLFPYISNYIKFADVNHKIFLFNESNFTYYFLFIHMIDKGTLIIRQNWFIHFIIVLILMEKTKNFGWVWLPNYKRHVNWSATCVFTDIGKLLSFKLQPGVQNNVIWPCVSPNYHTCWHFPNLFRIIQISQNLMLI